LNHNIRNAIHLPQQTHRHSKEMKKYKIEKNISLTRKKGRIKKYDFPLEDMEVGDSFQIHGDVRSVDRKLMLTQYQSVFTQAKCRGIKVTSRTQSDGSIRIWRVE